MDDSLLKAVLEESNSAEWLQFVATVLKEFGDLGIGPLELKTSQFALEEVPSPLTSGSAFKKLVKFLGAWDCTLKVTQLSQDAYMGVWIPGVSFARNDRSWVSMHEGKPVIWVNPKVVFAPYDNPQILQLMMMMAAVEVCVADELRWGVLRSLTGYIGKLTNVLKVYRLKKAENNWANPHEVRFNK